MQELHIFFETGLVPKQGNKLRLVFNLSYPPGQSLNDHTPKELSTTEYPDFQEAVRLCMKAGTGAYCAKSDLKSVTLIFDHFY